MDIFHEDEKLFGSNSVVQCNLWKYHPFLALFCGNLQMSGEFFGFAAKKGLEKFSHTNSIVIVDYILVIVSRQKFSCLPFDEQMYFLPPNEKHFQFSPVV